MKWKKEDFTVLQQEQIDLGKQHGLTKKQISIYAKSKYDFLQMQEIREALEAGEHPWRVQLKYHAWTSHMEMEKLHEKKDSHDIRIYPYFLSIGITWMIVVGMLIGLAIHLTKQSAPLLKEDHIELAKGEEISIGKYLVSGIQEENIIQVNETPKDLGNHLVVYQEKGKPVYDFLFVEIKDENTLHN